MEFLEAMARPHVNGTSYLRAREEKGMAPSPPPTSQSVYPEGYTLRSFESKATSERSRIAIPKPN